MSFPASTNKQQLLNHFLYYSKEEYNSQSNIKNTILIIFFTIIEYLNKVWNQTETARELYWSINKVLIPVHFISVQPRNRTNTNLVTLSKT